MFIRRESKIERRRKSIGKIARNFVKNVSRNCNIIQVPTVSGVFVARDYLCRCIDTCMRIHGGARVYECDI